MYFQLFFDCWPPLKWWKKYVFTIISQKSPIGPTERTPNPENLMARSQFTKRCPLGFGPNINFWWTFLSPKPVIYHPGIGLATSHGPRRTVRTDPRERNCRRQDAARPVHGHNGQPERSCRIKKNECTGARHGPRITQVIEGIYYWKLTAG